MPNFINPSAHTDSGKLRFLGPKFGGSGEFAGPSLLLLNPE
jgi:hypothetical protein